MRYDRAKLKPRVIALRRAGATLAEAATAIGVHIATLCRWQAADPAFCAAVREAAWEHAIEKYATADDRRPRVRWRNECPTCRAKLAVRTAAGGVWFWRCGRWPLCPWASWRPRHPRNCPTCHGPRFWSHSRKSVGCDACRVRIMTP